MSWRTVDDLEVVWLCRDVFLTIGADISDQDKVELVAVSSSVLPRMSCENG